MSRLRNKNICELVEAYSWDTSNVHLLMEPCHGDLWDYVRDTLSKLKGDEKLGEIKHISLGILNGVEYMHGEGVLHRDLKTQNILMKAGGGIKICDFGMARKIEEKDVTGERKRHYSTGPGTILYKAPEILMGHSDYGFEIDMWSVACIIAEMFIGTYAIRSDSAIMAGMFSEGYTPENGAIDQLNSIQTLCGDVDEVFDEDLDPDVTSGHDRKVRVYFEPYTEDNNDALDLLDEAFTLDPGSRPGPNKLLNNQFFHRGPDVIPSMTMAYCGTYRTFHEP